MLSYNYVVLGMREDTDPIDTPESAVEALAEVLHDRMEHLDPTDGTSWADLEDRKKEFYRWCIRTLAQYPAPLVELSRLEGARPQ